MNTQQIIHLWKAYFFENWKRDLCWFAITALCSMIFDSSIQTLLLFILLVFASKSFAHLHHPAARMRYLTLPAGCQEKVTAQLLLFNLYVIPALILSAFIGWSIMRIPVIQSHWFVQSDFPELLPLTAHLYIEGSIYFFCSIYFKKQTLIKMIGVYFAGVLLSFLPFILILLFSKVIAFHYITIYLGLPWHIVGPVVVLFFYFLSYLRLTETEA